MTTEDTWGVNYRALRDLFQLSEARKDFIEYEVGVQMIEIYNEQVRDLLVIDGSNRRYPSKKFIFSTTAFNKLIIGGKTGGTDGWSNSSKWVIPMWAVFCMV